MPFEKTEKIWMDGELVPWDEARVHVLTHSLHYGSGVFEGIRTYAAADGPAVFRLTDHIQRLLDSAKLIMMEIPYSRDELVDACKLTVRESGLDSCYVRPIAFLGYGEIGLNPLPCEVNVSIAAWPWGSYLGEESLEAGVRMKVSSWRRMDPNINPVAAKGTGIYINSSLAKVEAVQGGLRRGDPAQHAGLRRRVHRRERLHREGRRGHHAAARRAARSRASRATRS